MQSPVESPLHTPKSIKALNEYDSISNRRYSHVNSSNKKQLSSPVHQKLSAVPSKINNGFHFDCKDPLHPEVSDLLNSSRRYPMLKASASNLAR